MRDRRIPWPGIGILAAAVFCLLQCRLGNEPLHENFVSIKLNDSLRRYDSVEILVLAAGDTSRVVGTVWEGPLPNPSAIQDYRLSDGEPQPVAIRVRGFDEAGNLLMDMLISNVDGKQQVENLTVARPVSTPPVRLEDLHCNPGALVPVFTSDHHDYVVNLAHAESLLTLTAIPAKAQAVLTLGASSLTAGKPTDPIALKVGANEFSIHVAMGLENGIYTLTAIRAVLPPVISIVPVDSGHPDTAVVTTGGNSADTAFQAWKHKAALSIHLDALALPKESLLRDFPLLVRLTDANFNFSQAADSGKDIRFGRSGKTLAHEISRWETAGANRFADIWVKVDSLPGTIGTVAIDMFWGNASATGTSDGTLVFGTEAGNNGVWHMSESGTGAQGEYKDAGGRSNATGGNGLGILAPKRVKAVVGFGQDFQSGIFPSLMALPNDFDPGSDAWSFQAWIKPRGLTNGVLFQKGDAWQPNEQRFQIICLGEGGQQIAVERKAGIYFTDAFPPKDNFSYLAVTYASSTLSVYLNGIPYGSRNWTQGTKSVGKAIIGANSLQGDDEPFNGVLDEMWFASVARSAEWVRLAYENQKTGSTMVTLQPIR